jgi:hypothetical protein
VQERIYHFLTSYQVALWKGPKKIHPWNSALNASNNTKAAKWQPAELTNKPLTLSSSTTFDQTNQPIQGNGAQ